MICHLCKRYSICLTSLFIGNGFDEPLHAFLETFFGEGGAGLNIPSSFLDLRKFKSIKDLFSLNGKLKILLIGVDKKRDFSKCFLAHESIKFFNAFVKSFLITGVYNENYAICILIVVFPIWSDGFLTTDIPNIKFESILSQRLDIKTLGWHDRRNILL